MQLAMCRHKRILTVACLMILLNCQVYTEESFRYEKLHRFGQGRRVVPNYRQMNKYGYPEQLFPVKNPGLYVRSPYRNVYQGTKRKGDRRVYNEKFNHKAMSTAFRMVSQAALDCKITHIAVETNENVPIIYRGGAGYMYFIVIVKAEPGVEISGRVRAYCRNVTLGS